MDDIYMLTDGAILSQIGTHLKALRLKQNITQQHLSCSANVSLSSIKKMEKGEIRSFDALLRVLRTLGKLDVLTPLVEDEQLSPTEYYELVHAAGKKLRKRAAGKVNHANTEESEW